MIETFAIVALPDFCRVFSMFPATDVGPYLRVCCGSQTNVDFRDAVAKKHFKIYITLPQMLHLTIGENYTHWLALIAGGEGGYYRDWLIFDSGFAVGDEHIAVYIG